MINKIKNIDNKLNNMSGKSKDIVIIAVIFIVAILSLTVYLINPSLNSDDSIFHYANILEFKNTITSDNIFGSKIVGEIGNDFGYATKLFYPPLSHLSIAYLDLIIENITLSFKLFNVLVLFFSGIAMYFLSKNLSKSRKIGLLSAVIYMTFPYHMSNIQIRDALAESLIFVFTPIIINGIYHLIKGNRVKCFKLFTVGYVGLVLSHLTMACYFTFFMIILLCINYKKVFNFKNIMCLCLSSVFILAITSFFTMPLLEVKLDTEYAVFKEGVMVQGTYGHTLNLQLINIFDMFSEDIRYFIPISIIVMLIIGVSNAVKKHNIKNSKDIYIKLKEYFKIKNEESLESKFYISLFIILIITLIMISKLFYWDILPLSFRIIQFPWRLLGFIAIYISLLIPLVIKKYIVNKKSNLLIVILVLIISIECNIYFANIYNSSEKIDVDNLDYIVAMGWQKEYLPVETTIEYFENRDNNIISDQDVNIEIIEDNTPYLSFKVDTVEDEYITVELPRIYYKGYFLVNDEGANINVYKGDNGFICANITNGTYVLNYENTNICNICNIISIIFLSIFLIILIITKKK